MKRQAHPGPHKYVRKKWGKTAALIWRCILPGCAHYLHKEFIEGRMAKCHDCNSTFVMSKDKMERVKPKCDACQKTKSQGHAIDALDNLLKGL